MPNGLTTPRLHPSWAEDRQNVPPVDIGLTTIRDREEDEDIAPTLPPRPTLGPRPSRLPNPAPELLLPPAAVASFREVVHHYFAEIPYRQIALSMSHGFLGLLRDLVFQRETRNEQRKVLVAYELWNYQNRRR